MFRFFVCTAVLLLGFPIVLNAGGGEREEPNFLNTDMQQLHSLLRVIKNDLKDTLPTLSHSDSVRLNHEIECARDFKKRARSLDKLVNVTSEISHAELQTSQWNEIKDFDIGYGESVYVIPVGKMKFGETHAPVHPEGLIEFARKIGQRVGPAAKYHGDPLRVNSPDNQIVQLLWRVKDGVYFDNQNVDLKFAYFRYGGIGSMLSNQMTEACDYP